MNPELFSLKGQIAIVTGGGRGLGKAIAGGLAKAGARVALVSRTRLELEGAAAEIGHGTVAVPADVSDPDRLSRLLDTCESELGGTVGIVVHAAGIQHRAAAEDFPIEQWQRILDVNLTAPFFLSQEVARRQLAGSLPGSHIFIGSLTSRIGLAELAAYAATKSGLMGAVRTLSTEWSGRGIRVNGIAPGYFSTEMTRPVFEHPERYESLLGRIPMGRFGDPQELAGAAVFLASSAASYVTGQVITVDGGWLAN